MDNGKCPCCEITIEDERLQVRHTERCHPELLRQRWEKSGMTPDEIAMHTKLARANHPPFEELIGECTAKDWVVHVLAAPGEPARVAIIPRNVSGADGQGETLTAALCLAMDRMEYRT